MFCPECGRQCEKSAQFCQRCGARLEEMPRWAVPMLEQGYTALQQGDLERALALLAEACSVAPDDPRAHLGLAIAHLHRGDLNQAEAALRRTLDLDPAQAVAHAYLGALLVRHYQVADARVEMDLALKHGPGEFIVRLKRGEFFYRLGFFPDAVAELRTALALPAPSPESRLVAQELLMQARDRAKGSFTRQAVFPFRLRKSAA